MLPAGSSSVVELRSWSCDSGMANTASTASTPPSTHHGRRWTRAVSREKAPSSDWTSAVRASTVRRPGIRLIRPGRMRRRPNNASIAGTRVSALATAMMITATPAAPKERRIAGEKTSRPAIEIATVSAENATVRPAVSMVRTSAVVTAPSPRRRREAAPSSSSTRRWSSSRNRDTISSP